MIDYKDPKYTSTERANALLSLMTNEEKVGQMMQLAYKFMTREEALEWAKKGLGSYLHVLGDNADELQRTAINETRLGIPIIFGIDCIHGHALNEYATVFPTQLTMAQSFDREAMRKCGRVSATEVRCDSLHWTFSPVFCIGRDTRWGRINETFGEDPYLIGELGAAIVDGYQNNFVDNTCIMACAKHYIAYGESIGGRDAYDSMVSERMIRETFLPPFQKAAKAGCKTYMTGYQSVDGVPMNSNRRLLREVLKEEVGVDGFIITDWANVRSLIENQKVCDNFEDASRVSIDAGNDMIMQTEEFYDAALKLIENGQVDMKHIDDSVFRILKAKFDMGLFEHPFEKPDRSKICCDEHVAVDLEVTRESMTLLKNDGVLPINTKKVRKIAVIGPNADDLEAQYGDWSCGAANGHRKPATSMLKGIKKRAKKDGIEVVYKKGCDIEKPGKRGFDAAIKAANESDLIIAVMGDYIELNGEYKSRATLDLPGEQTALLQELKKTKKPIVLVMVNGKPLCINWEAENTNAILETFNSGMVGGTVAAEILFGDVNPSGKLPISFPRTAGQVPVYYNYLPGWHGDNKYKDIAEGPLYPFGFGLSYTTFEYSDLSVSKTEFTEADGEIIVTAKIKNTGKVKGTEIAQMYIHDVVGTVMRPVLELKGFERVELDAGEEKVVSFTLPVEELKVVEQNLERVLEKGDFEIMVGGSSVDLPLMTTIKAI
ncbi:MAG: glycoside hydrolase family 3 C-terminal domain-containing protein [Clostridia bacterium]|nr:glycoside hydrolase family 3 C-terminal domain-containing protein [Clostridia bacterium]